MQTKKGRISMQISTGVYPAQVLQAIMQWLRVARKAAAQTTCSISFPFHALTKSQTQSEGCTMQMSTGTDPAKALQTMMEVAVDTVNTVAHIAMETVNKMSTVTIEQLNHAARHQEALHMWDASSLKLHSDF